MFIQNNNMKAKLFDGVHHGLFGKVLHGNLFRKIHYHMWDSCFIFHKWKTLSTEAHIDYCIIFYAFIYVKIHKILCLKILDWNRCFLFMARVDSCFSIYVSQSGWAHLELMMIYTITVGNAKCFESGRIDYVWHYAHFKWSFFPIQFQCKLCFCSVLTFSLQLF